ncbi:MAG: sugar transferase [Ancrocorticia sp.]|uniref:sugar transferase n=1 Tax=Ancrocorticia sp. TaxID=2593684 RepID=UPI003F8DBE17
MQAFNRRPYDAVKRAMDIALAGIGLVVLSPVMVMTGGVVVAFLGRPMFFVQERPGLGGNAFKLTKFRTMAPPVDDDQEDSERVSIVGNMIRASSLDELPALWNVLKGDMSLVGPRPLLTWYMDHYTPEQARRHEVRPGITGLAQVKGRNTLSWEEKFRYDLEYVEKRSLRLDLDIICRTLAVVLTRRGIAHEGSVSMPPFAEYTGSNEHAHRSTQ